MTAEPLPFVDGGAYQDERFVGVSAPALALSGAEFEGCTFERVTLAGATLRHCVLRDCRFIRCDLSLLTLPNCRLSEVRFDHCKLIGVDWTAAAVSAVDRGLFAVDFADCVLDYGNFFGLSLRRRAVERCSAREVSFSEADLREASGRDSDFSGAIFLHTNLEDADFTAAHGYAIDPTANRVRGLRLSLPAALALLEPFGVVLA